MTEERSSSGGTGRPDEEDESAVVEGEIIEGSGTAPRADVVAGKVVDSGSRQALSPTPEELARYEAIQPGFTNRILTLTEKETEHRIRREDKQDDATIKLADRGQILAFIVVMTLVLGGVAAILTGHSVAGFAGLVIAAATLTGAFIAPEIFSRKALGPAPPGTEIEPRKKPTRAPKDHRT